LNPRELLRGEGELFSFHEALRLLRNQTYAMACLAIFFVTFQRTGIRSTMIPLYGIELKWLNELAIGTIISYAIIANLLITVPMGYAIDLLGRKPVIIWNTVIMAATNLSFVYAKDYCGMSLAGVLLGLAWLQQERVRHRRLWLSTRRRMSELG
jgi:MFS family permease